MTTYTYSLFARFLYRYANILVTIFLSMFALSALLMIQQRWYFFFVFLVNAAIIFYVNRFYVRGYKTFPYKITLQNGKLICSNYFLSKKVVELEIKNIDNIWGGFISGWQTRPIYIHDKETNVTVGIFVQSKIFKKLMKTIFENIPEYVYQDILQKMKGDGDAKKNPGKPGL